MSITTQKAQLEKELKADISRAIALLKKLKKSPQLKK
jgi:hypothetical protein